jgi:hypothetical protein
MLRARNECNQLIGAYDMPDWERAEFDTLGLVEEVVMESMELSPAEVEMSATTTEEVIGRLRRHTLACRRDARLQTCTDGEFIDRVASQKSLGNHHTALSDAQRRAHKQHRDKTWQRNHYALDGSLVEEEMIETVDGNLIEVPASFSLPMGYEGVTELLFTIIAVMLFMVVVAATCSAGTLAAAFILCSCTVLLALTNLHPKPRDVGSELSWLVRANYCGVKVVSLLAE